MDVPTAMRLLGEMSSRPGYRHEVYDYRHRQADSVVVRITQEGVRDSDRQFWPEWPSVIAIGGLPEGDLPADFELYVGNLWEMSDLTHALVSLYLRYDAHEHREFLRDADGVAHLHPHVFAGQVAWSTRDGDHVGIDRAYGVRRIAEPGMQ